MLLLSGWTIKLNEAETVSSGEGQTQDTRDIEEKKTQRTKNNSEN